MWNDKILYEQSIHHHELRIYTLTWLRTFNSWELLSAISVETKNATAVEIEIYGFLSVICLLMAIKSPSIYCKGLHAQFTIFCDDLDAHCTPSFGSKKNKSEPYIFLWFIAIFERLGKI